MTFERSTDYPLIRQIMTANPRSYAAHCDDFAAPIDEFQVREDALIWYVIARASSGTVLGLFAFVPLSPVLWDVHNFLLPIAWGSQAIQAGRGAAKWMFANSGARRIAGATPAYLRLAVAFAKRCGMVEYGRNPRSFQKGGELHDLILMGISKD